MTNVTPSSFEPLIRQTIAPVLLLAYEETCPNNTLLHSLFMEASLSVRKEALFARANLSQHPELARLIGIVAPVSLMMYWGGVVRYQFLGQFTRPELAEILVRAEVYSSLKNPGGSNSGDRSSLLEDV